MEFYNIFFFFCNFKCNFLSSYIGFLEKNYEKCFMKHYVWSDILFQFYTFLMMPYRYNRKVECFDNLWKALVFDIILQERCFHVVLIWSYLESTYHFNTTQYYSIVLKLCVHRNDRLICFIPRSSVAHGMVEAVFNQTVSY